MTFEEIVEEMRVTNKMMWEDKDCAVPNWLTCTPEEALIYANFEVRRARAIRMYEEAIAERANMKANVEWSATKSNGLCTVNALGMMMLLDPPNLNRRINLKLNGKQYTMYCLLEENP